VHAAEPFLFMPLSNFLSFVIVPFTHINKSFYGFLEQKRLQFDMAILMSCFLVFCLLISLV
jgi:hypothetical protein